MRKFTLIPVIALLVIIIALPHSEVHTNSVQPPAMRTGAPGELTCGNDLACHNTTPNTFGGNVAISFSDPGNEYIPGTSYTLTVTVTDVTQSRFGFEITSLDSNDTQAGSFAEITGSTDISFPISFNGRLYAAHHNANTSNTFNFEWIAPITDVGCITFYAAGNAANGNGTSTGDHIYTSNLTICTATSLIVNNLHNDNHFLLQNPVSDHLNLQYLLNESNHLSIGLFNTSGKLVKRLYEGNNGPGIHSHSFEIGDLSPGLYLVQVQSGNSYHTEKIIVQKP